MTGAATQHGAPPPGATDDSSEQTPLLGTDAAGPKTPDGNGDDGGDDKPMAVGQIMWLCYARLVEPLAFFCVFPYIGQMVRDNGHLAPADVGFYAGLIESLFSLTQVAVTIAWGRAADRVGRKPVLVVSLAGLTLSTAVFGMATTLWQMVLFRCLAGANAGTAVTLRTMVAENSTPRTQARAFSWFAFASNLGTLLGPLVGGALADPARQYPGVFGGVRFFEAYPYALPSFVVGAVGLSSAVTSALFLKETLKREPPAAGDGPAKKAKKDPGSVLELVKAPGVGIVLVVYAYVMLLALAYTAMAPVFWYTPVALGGFGLESFQISILLAVTGLGQASWLLLAFPPLQRRLGTNGVMRACAYGYPAFFPVCCVAASALLRAGAVRAFWVAVPPLLLLSGAIAMTFTGAQLLLNEVNPSPRALGTLNALALTGFSALRSFCPALFASLFALGARTQWLGGYAIWALMTLLTLGLIAAARRLPEKEDLERMRAAAREDDAEAEAEAGGEA